MWDLADRKQVMEFLCAEKELSAAYHRANSELQAAQRKRKDRDAALKAANKDRDAAEKAILRFDTAIAMDHYLETGEYSLEYEGCPCFMDCKDEDIFCDRDGGIYYITTNIRDFQDEDMSERFQRMTGPGVIPSAVIVPSNTKKMPGNRKNHLLLVVNADGDNEWQPYWGLVNALEKFQFPAISFRCLSMLVGTIDKPVGPTDLVRALYNGTLFITDYVPDEFRPLSDEEKDLRKRRQKLTPPPGFTLLDHAHRKTQWHRTATVVFRNYRKNESYLVGRDEDAYFGCQLKHTVGTIDAAYKDLTPKAAQVAGVLRQGEWFMIPVDKGDIPDKSECAALWECEHYDCTRVALPIETEANSRHFLRSVDGRISRDGKVYAYNCAMEHENEEHVEVRFQGWCTFARNTAVRSVSVQGVD